MSTIDKLIDEMQAGREAERLVRKMFSHYTVDAAVQLGEPVGDRALQFRMTDEEARAWFDEASQLLKAAQCRELGSIFGGL